MIFLRQRNRNESGEAYKGKGSVKREKESGREKKEGRDMYILI